MNALQDDSRQISNGMAELNLDFHICRNYFLPKKLIRKLAQVFRRSLNQ
jgi:hypothetical protein